MQSVWANESGETLDGRLLKLLESKRLSGRFISIGSITEDTDDGTSSRTLNGEARFVLRCAAAVYSSYLSEGKMSPYRLEPN